MRSFWVLLALMHVSAFAKVSNVPEQKWILKSHQEIQVLVLHQENHLSWDLELISEPSGKFPHRLWTRRFEDKKEAVRFAEKFRKENASGSQLFSQNLFRLRTLTEAPQTSLWKVTEQWNLDWEKKYAVWIENNLTDDFFQKYKISTDCADVAFSLKWIFARIHGLPMANTLIGSGALFTHESVKAEWLLLPTSSDWFQDQRFLAALDYVLSYTYTHSLINDSYPIAMTPEAMMPGTHHLSIHTVSGHTMIVAKRDLSDQSLVPLTVFFSSTPRVIRKLYSSGYWESKQPQEGSGGFQRIRWPVFQNGKWSLLAPETHPGFSKEQFQPEFMDKQTNFAQAVLSRLNPNINFMARIENGVQLVKQTLQDRMEIVKNGFENCLKIDCSPGTAGDEAWGTTNRDLRVIDLYFQMKNMIQSMGGRMPELAIRWAQLIQEQAVMLEGENFTINSLFEIWRLGSYSSDARVSVARRWGLQVVPFGDFIRERFEKLYTDRLKRITEQGSECAAQCEPLSVNWMKWNTFDIDSQLARISTAAAHYCENVSAERCTLLQAALSTESLTLASKTLTLKKWLEREIWLVSDPRASTARRLGEHQALYRWKLFEGYSSFIVRPSGHAYFKLESFSFGMGESSINSVKPAPSFEIYDLIREEKVLPPAGMEWSTIKPGRDLAIAQFPHALQSPVPSPSAAPEDFTFSIKNLARDNIYTATPSFRGSFKFADLDLVFYESSDHARLTLLDFKTDPVFVLNDLPKNYAWDITVPAWFEIKENQVVKLYIYDSFKLNTVEVQDYQSLLSFLVRPSSVYAVTDNHVFLNLMKCMEPTCKLSFSYTTMLLVIDKRNGHVRTLGSDTNGFIKTRDPQTFAQYSRFNGAINSLITFDGELNVIKTTVLHGNYRVDNDSEFTHIYPQSGEEGPFYRYSSGKWEVFQLLKDEQKFLSQSHGYVAVETKNHSTRIRRFDSAKVLFETNVGTVFFYGTEGKILDYVAVFYGDQGQFIELYDLRDLSAPILTKSPQSVSSTPDNFEMSSQYPPIEQRGLKFMLSQKLGFWLDDY